MGYTWKSLSIKIWFLSSWDNLWDVRDNNDNQTNDIAIKLKDMQ